MRTGWANSCGVELFTHGWVTCEKLLNTLIDPNYGGTQFNNFLIFKPIRAQLEKATKNKIPLSLGVIDSIENNSGINLDHYVFDINDTDYRLAPDITAQKFLSDIDIADGIIKKASTKISVPINKVREKLVEVVAKELQKQRDFKVGIFKDDQEIIEILIMTEEL